MTDLEFDHVGIETTMFEADLAWFQDVLGARLLRVGAHVVTGLRIAMLAADPKTELVEVDEANGRFTHTAYRVDDVAAAADELIASGASADGPLIRIEPARADSRLLRLPGGAAVQLIRYDADSPDLG